eukprot:scaffold76440_cov52-Attheya_sp.AAC.1
MAMLLFEEYGVTACVSGHFHQNVVAKASWGMGMIVMGPLSMSMTLRRTTSPEVYLWKKNPMASACVWWMFRNRASPMNFCPSHSLLYN